MGAQGLRDLGEGQEQMANAEEVAALRAQSRMVNLLTVGSALLATALVVLASR